MKLATFRAPGHAEPFGGVVDDGTVTAIGGADSVREVLAGTRSPEAGSEEWAMEHVELLAPVPRPGTIYAVGLNYQLHIEESGVERPPHPVVFVKPQGAAAPPRGPIRRPSVVEELDYEGELAIVIGAGGRIGGFCVANDVSARDLQRNERFWTRAKGADTFCPFGPWITTVDEVGDADDLRLQTWVNGELRQDSRTSHQIFDCEQLVAFIAETCTLRPGDIILTGTPDGVGRAMDPPQFLNSGDRIKVAIEGLGEIENHVA